MTVIPGISALKKRPRAGLLTVASLLPAVDWRRGIDYVPEGCTPPDVVATCGDDIEKPASNPQEAINFMPFGVVSTDGCNDPWFTNDEFYARAERSLDMGQSAVLAAELVQSTVNSNPDLATAATDVTPGGGSAVDWVQGATLLLEAMANAGYVGDVVIHAPTWLQPAFEHAMVGDTDPATRQSYIGVHPVVFDAGYGGLVGPSGEAGEALSGIAGWVYATGPIEYAFGPLLDEAAIAGDNLTNDRYVVAERPGIVRFDPCQVFAVLVKAYDVIEEG